MSKTSGVDKSSANAPISIPLILGSVVGVFLGAWQAFAAFADRQQSTFGWWDVTVPGVIALASLVLLIWAIVPRK